VSSRYAISTATVVLLVVLRLNIGWHFFSEGIKHYADPDWTSEPVLRAATGPLAPMYHAYLPDFHGMESWLHGEGPQKESSAVTGFLDEIQADGDDYRQQFALHYELTPAQQKRASQTLNDYQARVRSWGGANRDALANHVHQWRRAETAGQRPDAADVPYQKGRVNQARGELKAEAAAWKAELTSLERDYQNELAGLLSAEQRETSPLAPPATSIDLVDMVMTYVILAIGLLLLLGLFTRTACLAGAVFLLSVVMTQPFWVSESQPTFNQFVEMFALLMLGTTHVGRWAGLDFFVHNLIAGRENAPASDTP
jgi:uncharacterized membrane protein YphA (DoxX/SURF4 family)